MALSLPSEAHCPFSRMFGLRLVSEAIGQLGFPGVVAGEATRVTLLGSEIPLASRILSVTLDRGLFIACGAIVTVCGITAGFLLLSLSNALRIYTALFAISFLGVVFAAALAVRKGWPLLSGPARALGRVPWVGRWVQSKESLIFSVEEQLLQFHRERPSAFWGSVTLNFVCHGLAITEVFLILLFMGKNVTWVRSLILESFTKLINVAGSLTPGNVGVYEGGTMLIATLFGLSGTVGLTLGFCRRLRGIFWTVVGVLSFYVVSRSVGHLKTSDGSDPAREDSPAPLEEPRANASCEPAPETTTAIILADDYHDTRGFTPELAHVGTLPIILRAILQAQGVNASRIIVASSGLARIVIRRELLRTRRLPERVEWFESASVSNCLGWLARLQQTRIAPYLCRHARHTTPAFSRSATGMVGAKRWLSRPMVSSWVSLLFLVGPLRDCQKVPSVGRDTCRTVRLVQTFTFCRLQGG